MNIIHQHDTLKGDTKMIHKQEDTKTKKKIKKRH